MPYSPVSHGQMVRATLIELLASLDEAAYQLARLERLEAATADLAHARQATAFAQSIAQDAVAEEVPSTTEH